MEKERSNALEVAKKDHEKKEKKDSKHEIKLIESFLKELQSLKSSNNYHNISWRLANFLSNLVLIKSPKNILEIGTSNGFSTLFIAKSLPKTSQLTSIEIDKNRHMQAKSNIERFNLSNIRLINSSIKDFIDSYNSSKRFDLVFLDADQKNYITTISRLLKKRMLCKNALLIADNISSHSYMQSHFIPFISNYFSIEIVELDSGFIVAKLN